MRRAVAFANRISDSQKLSSLFQEIIAKVGENPLPSEIDFLACETQHVDGGMSAPKRNKALDWLREEPSSNERGEPVCKLLFNAKCLGEGVDVPSLDAVLFMQPRKSEIDIVQAVGRVMRTAPGKDYGYVVVPVVVNPNEDPAKALEGSNYKAVWQVLNALRAHDDRFQSIINKIELNKAKPENIRHIGIGFGQEDETFADAVAEATVTETKRAAQLALWEQAIYAKIVDKCGERGYWVSWAKDVANIHTTLVERIETLRTNNSDFKMVYHDFLADICRNINDNLTKEDATSMLAQHLITRPVFDALFADYEFANSNPVSRSINNVIDRFNDSILKSDLDDLERFYDSVRSRAAGIDNAIGRQEVIIDLFENFFEIAFPRVARSFGIAYTPIKIVDFVLASADYALRSEFGRSLSDEGVHIIDPFTGTGSFINRLIQNSDLIKDKDLERKFNHELHANEILLLIYYIASVNIEEAFHDRAGGDYRPFPGIVLTDTFNLFERDTTGTGEMFPENDQRLARQRKAPIRVIVGNPPWSRQQKSENDNAKNMIYPKLDDSIRASYAAHSKANNKNILYDSYIRAFRWASDRLGDEGIIAFVSPSAWIDRNFADGMRQILAEEFDRIYLFDLRGDIRKDMLSKGTAHEGENIFENASMSGCSISILIRRKKSSVCQIYYHDIGNDLKREHKIDRIVKARHIGGLIWRHIIPNTDYDWINQHDPRFQYFKSLGNKQVKSGKMAQPDTIFSSYSLGIATNRDFWAYNFSRSKLIDNMERTITFYNEQVKSFAVATQDNPRITPDTFIDNDPSKISWDGNLKKDLAKGKYGIFDSSAICLSSYRPFCLRYLYFDRHFNNSVYRQPSYFPKPDIENRAIIVPGIGSREVWSPLIVNRVPNLDFIEKSQCFPRYVWSKDGQRQDNITETAVREFRTLCGDDSLTGDDIFDYVYGILHAPDYQRDFAIDLKKSLPRIPMPKDATHFEAFRDAGHRLAELHLNFETGPEYPLNILIDGAPALPGVPEETSRRVIKMAWGKQDGKEDRTRIVYNERITIAGIPEAALRYQVAGRPALKWLIERYQIKTDKASGIQNDPNDWIAEQGDPQWLIRHIQRITYLSIESAKIIDGLPPAY
ncbi:type ISP restriction/modification enzyme [Thioalkalivibrio sp. HK1]|uniref:type ISP restriction/modification enzyme n=1 Tax=Thioalkalivibrio sp. HK1 TaxID=1469245 RepID=UPI000471FB80|nr:type ISP restriction/modification enzyme [Thioalkalivibrio sp. HK1]